MTIKELIELDGPEGKHALEPGYQPYRIVFENPGLVDMDAVKTFGVNAKENENPIGFFGTGLKYAIAIALREGGKFSILRGHERYDFTVRGKMIRGTDFGVVHCNDEPLAFTINLGKTWKPWMALRELYCNAVDEKGTVKLQEAEPAPEENVTKMWVTGEEFGRIWAEERGAFLLQTKAIGTSPYIDVHPGSTPHLYYNGIRAYTGEKPFMFTYNIKSHLILTEDRTIAWEWQAKDYIYRGLLLLDNPAVLRKLFACYDQDDEKWAEYDFKYPEKYDVSPQALEVIRELHAAKRLRGGSGLGYYHDTDFLDRMTEEDCQLSERELATLEGVKRFFEASGLDPYYHSVVVTEALTAVNKYHVSTRGMGIGFKIRDGALTLGVDKERHTLFIARAAVMQGVEVTIDVILEALLESRSGTKDDMRRSFILTLMTLLSFNPDFKVPAPKVDDVI